MTLEERLVAQYGVPGPAPWIVVLLLAESGEIGGYRAGLAILDSPVDYFLADGTHVGRFHVFSPEENAKDEAAIADLRRRFPGERPFDPSMGRSGS